MMRSMDEAHPDRPRSIEPFGPDDTRPFGRTEPRFTPGPVTLEGRVVRLEPLSLDHVPALAEVALDPAIWRWTIARPTTEAELRTWALTTIAARDAGAELPFATIDRASGRPIGSSRYMNIAMDHRRIEIGWTWVGTAFQRTGANREAKLLMLRHAFDTLGCRRVEFKTDALNEKSRT